MQEKAFFFPNKNKKKLFGFYHIPAQEEHHKKKAILICQPIFEERVFAYLFLTKFAREACRQGYHVFRFDYFGYGDSEGEASETTINSMLSDIEDAFDLFTQDNKLTEVCLMGYRFGGTLAALFAEQHSKQKRLILWDPIINASAYINHALRQAISTQTVVFKKILVTRDTIIENIKADKPTIIEGYNLATVDGYPLTKTLFEEITPINLTEISSYPAHTYLSYLVQPKRKISSEQEKLQKHIGEQTNLGYDVVEEPVLFWKDNIMFKNTSIELYRNTLQWLEETPHE